jgi:Aromatic-ring-opening dioxygenase LigAB, LigA subunit
MSTYALNKLLREVNRNPGIRERFLKDASAVAAEYDLTEEERRAAVERDVSALYRLGVHGLILRPFTIIHEMPEPAYLEAIRR